MPLIRIDFQKRQDDSFGKRLGDIVYRAMMGTINIPEKDNFQIIREHDSNHFIFDESYLDIPRTDALIMVQITLNEGRTIEQKKALYKLIAENFHTELGIRVEDVLINLVEVKKENWSFGNGIAQYAPAS